MKEAHKIAWARALRCGAIVAALLVGTGPSTSALAVCTAAPVAPVNGTYQTSPSCVDAAEGTTCNLTCSFPLTTQSAADPVCTSGAWSTDPLCYRAGTWCISAPPAVANSSRAACVSVPALTACSTTCNTGFTKVGRDPVCLGSFSATTYWSPNPYCAAQCSSAPPAPGNGSYTGCAGTLHGNSCSPTCNPGYQQSGSSLTCNDGSWTGTPPTCEPHHCTVAPTVPNALSLDSCAGKLSGESCPVVCRTGHTKLGGNPVCVVGATWSGLPTCEPNACGSPPTPVANGTYGSCSLVPSGGTCPLTCDPGYTKVGTEQTCALGVWTGPAPTCEPHHCTVGPTVPNALNTEGCAGKLSGESCPVVCRIGHTRLGGNPVCVVATTWNGVPTCEPNGCGSPPAPVANGTYDSCSLVPSGSTCPLTCDPGYTKVGTEQTCTLGIYTGPAPTCTQDATTTTTTLAPTTTTTLAPTTTTTTLPLPCGAIPATGCRQVGSGKALLLLKDRNDSLLWKWKKGAAANLADFGAPLTGPGDYRLCLYDASARTQPLAELTVPFGAPWAPSGSTGYLYSDTAGASDGVTLLKLKAPAPEKTSILARGSSVPMPTLPLTTPVVVQFVANDGRGECWQAVYTTASVSSVDRFKAAMP